MWPFEVFEFIFGAFFGFSGGKLLGFGWKFRFVVLNLWVLVEFVACVYVVLDVLVFEVSVFHCTLVMKGELYVSFWFLRRLKSESFSGFCFMEEDFVDENVV